MAKREIIYIPILKSKAGERWALSHLNPAAKSKIRPVLELHSHKVKLLGDHVGSVCEALQAAWGADRAFYVDTIWLNGNLGSPAIIEEVFEAMRDNDLQAIPVVRPTYDDASLEQLQEIIVEDNRGYMLRITPDVLNTPALIDAIVEAIGVPINQIDLLLDYRQHPMTLDTEIPHVPHLPSWRLLIAASGVFPISLLSLPLHQWHRLPRHDWLSWQAGVGTSIRRKPLFADYTMRPPGAPADYGEPSVNLRYTREKNWLVQIGGKLKDGAAVEMHAMAAELIARPQYMGAEFSAGDEEIERVSDDEEGPGAPTQWLQWCVNHHIEFAVHQLSPDGA